MRTIYVRDIPIGENCPVIIQTMTNTKTKDIVNTINQINDLVALGAQIVRVAVVDEADAQAIKTIKAQVSIPIVADIHFDYRLALLAISAGVDKLRINPGNIDNPDHLKLIVDACKENHIPIRIGANAGSIKESILHKYPHDLASALIESVNEQLKILENLDFHDIVISIKASDIDTMILANTKAAKIFDYPLHIGLTESGTALVGTVKSTYAIAKLLEKGIGNTIRVSLTGDPRNEVIVAKEILKTLKLATGPTLISCPTCGRTDYNMEAIIKQIEPFINTLKKPIKIAIMGCVVNGPGEARDADIGIAGGKNQAVLFKKGIVIRKIAEKDIVTELINELKNF